LALLNVRPCSLRLADLNDSQYNDNDARYEDPRRVGLAVALALHLLENLLGTPTR
jgi:hypothetical protein